MQIMHSEVLRPKTVLKNRFCCCCYFKAGDLQVAPTNLNRLVEVLPFTFMLFSSNNTRGRQNSNKPKLI